VQAAVPAHPTVFAPAQPGQPDPARVWIAWPTSGVSLGPGEKIVRVGLHGFRLLLRVKGSPTDPAPAPVKGDRGFGRSCINERATGTSPQ